MNKSFLCVVVAVCVLGMVLLMLQEKLHSPSAPAPVEEPAPAAQAPAASPLPGMPAASPVETAPPAQPTPLPAGETPPQGVPAAAPALPTPPAVAGQPGAAAPTVAPAPAPKSEPLPAPKPAPASAPKPEPLPAPRAESSPQSRPAPAARPAQEEKRPDAPQERMISKFVVYARDKGATVRLVGASPLSYKGMELENPRRVVVDLEGEWHVKAPGVPRNVMVSGVRLGKSGKGTRVVLDLAQKARVRYVHSADRKTLDIRLDE